MATNPVIIRENPRPSGAPATSEAGKVEVETKGWAREISKALRSLYTQVQDLAATVKATAVATTTTATGAQAVTDSAQKINAPSSAVADGDMVLFSDATGRNVKSGGKPSGGAQTVPKNFSLVLDMAVLNPGALTNFTYDVNIAVMGLIGSAGGGIGSPGDNLPNAITAAHDKGSAFNTPSNARFIVFKSDGTALPSTGLYRVNFMVFP